MASPIGRKLRLPVVQVTIAAAVATISAKCLWRQNGAAIDENRTEGCAAFRHLDRVRGVSSTTTKSRSPEDWECR